VIIVPKPAVITTYTLINTVIIAQCHPSKLTGIKLICVEVEHNLLQYYKCKSHWSYNIQTSLCKLNQTWQNPWPRLKPDSSQKNHHKTDRLTPYCRQTQTPPDPTEVLFLFLATRTRTVGNSTDYCITCQSLLPEKLSEASSSDTQRWMPLVI
jgi:hypothetical protein